MKEQLIKEGMSEIRTTMKKYNKKIDAAPSRSSYNKFTGKYDETKGNLRRAKADAIKDIVQDYALLGVTLLDGTVLDKYETE